MGIQIKVPQQVVTQDHTHPVNQQKRIPTRYDLTEEKTASDVYCKNFDNFYQVIFWAGFKCSICKPA